MTVSHAETGETIFATDPEEYHKHGVHVTRSLTINRTAPELYAFWRNLENLPCFMTHIESVTQSSAGISHWRARGPGDKVYEWDAQILRDEPDRLIAWQSLAGADVKSAGSVGFVETGDRGTEVHVTLNYIPPGGKIGSFLAKLTGDDPEQILHEDLRRFKQLMETGELANSAGPRGNCSDDRAEGGAK